MIIEEAAGVLKYKDRKKKAEQKLLETTENVSRVLDIIFELETQIEPLKRQKSIAKDYLAQKEQLRDIEIAFTAIQIDQLVKETKQMKQESNHLTNELKTAQKQMKYTKDNSVQLQEKQKKIRNEQEKIQNEQIQLVKTIEQLEGQKILLREQNKHSEEYKQSAQKKLKELSAAENQIKSDINEIKQLAKEKQTNKEKLTNRLLEAEKEVELLSEDPKKIEAELRDNYIDS
ncbi:MAG: chromosome segregation protein SMC, partial [Pisciglobus halotolerans]|nr:chromosome segregation protein SMC [Pisciglobus halotolerans]